MRELGRFEGAVAVLEGGAIAGVGTRSRRGTNGAVAATESGVIRECILHGCLWPCGRGHGGNVVEGRYPEMQWPVFGG